MFQLVYECSNWVCEFSTNLQVHTPISVINLDLEHAHNCNIVLTKTNLFNIKHVKGKNAMRLHTNQYRDNAYITHFPRIERIYI